MFRRILYVCYRKKVDRGSLSSNRMRCEKYSYCGDNAANTIRSHSWKKVQSTLFSIALMLAYDSFNHPFHETAPSLRWYSHRCFQINNHSFRKLVNSEAYIGRHKSAKLNARHQLWTFRTEKIRFKESINQAHPGSILTWVKALFSWTVYANFQTKIYSRKLNLNVVGRLALHLSHAKKKTMTKVSHRTE